MQPILGFIQGIFQLLDTRILFTIKAYFASKHSPQVFDRGSNLWSEMAASDLSNSSPALKCVREHLEVYKISWQK